MTQAPVKTQSDGGKVPATLPPNLVLRQEPEAPSQKGLNQSASLGKGCPDTPPTQTATVLAQMAGMSQVTALQQLQRYYGNHYVNQVIQANLQPNGGTAILSSMTADSDVQGTTLEPSNSEEGTNAVQPSPAAETPAADTISLQSTSPEPNLADLASESPETPAEQAFKNQEEKDAVDAEEEAVDAEVNEQDIATEEETQGEGTEEETEQEDGEEAERFPEEPKATEAAAESADRGTGTTIAEFRTQVRQRAASIPRPRVTAGITGGGKIQQQGRSAADLIHIVQQGVPQEATAVLQPGPQGVPPVPAATPENPVPHADWLVEQASGRRLDDQSPPPLTASPRGNFPQMGRRPLPPEQIRRLHNVLSEGPPVSDPSDPARDQLVMLHEELIHQATAPSTAGPPVPFQQPKPRPIRPLEATQRTQVTQVFARLLADPGREAGDILVQVRSGLLPNNAVQRKLPDLGQDTLLPNLTIELTHQLHVIATEAGVAGADLDREIFNRQEFLRAQQLAAQAEVNQCSVDASQLVSTAGQSLSNTVATERARINAQTDSVQAAMQGGDANALVRARRDRMLVNVTRRVAEQTANYRQAGERRDRELTQAETDQVAAFQSAAQQDEFQLNERPPADADPVRVRELILASQQWGEDKVREVRRVFGDMKRHATDQTTTFRNEIQAAGEAAREEIRTWAAAQTGEVRTWWDRLFESFQDWINQAQANADAWEAAQNRQTAETVVQNLDMIQRLQAAAQSGISEETLLRENRLTAEQRAIVRTFFHRRPGATFDPIELLAIGVRTSILEQRRASLTSSLETALYESTWQQLQEVGNAAGSPVDVRNRAMEIHGALHGGIFGSNETDRAMNALSGLNRPQSEALKKFYQSEFEIALETDLHREFRSGWSLGGLIDTEKTGEERRAIALLGSDQATATAAQLYTAMHEQFLGTGLGTDEATIFRALRNLSQEQREAVIAAYHRDYNKDLRADLRSELEDWATPTTHDVNRANALLDGHVSDADAIAIDQSLYTGFGFSRRADVAAVYDQIATDVREQANREGWTTAQMQAELTRRTQQVEREYDTRYTNTNVMLPDAEGNLQSVRHGSLRESFDRMTWGADRDLLNALADNNIARADAARIRIERESLIYSDGTEINGVLRSQYDRALADVRRDMGPERRRALEREMAAREAADRAAGFPWTAEERYRQQQSMERTLEAQLVAAARQRADGYMQTMTSTYAGQYGESVQTVVRENVQNGFLGMGGDNRTEALTLIAQGGYLNSYQRLDFAVRGAGTREEDVRQSLRGLTRAEIEELDQRWRREHNGQSLFDLLDSELSGQDWTDARIAMMGAPETLDQAVAIERLRVELSRPTNRFSELVTSQDWFAGHERRNMEAHFRELEEFRERLRSPHLTPEQQQELLGEFDFRTEATSTAVEIHQQAVNSVTESIANTASMAVALAIGFGGAIFTGGASAAVALAIVASLAATATSIATRAALMGNAYGAEQLYTDLAVGAVDAVVAAFTAGMGSRLMGLRQVGPELGQVLGKLEQQGASRFRMGLVRAMARLGNTGRLTQATRAVGFLERMAAEEASWYSRALANVLSEAIENTVQSMPTALLGSAIDEQNWQQGNPLANILSGSGQQLAHGLVTGLAVGRGMHYAQAAAGHLGSLFRGPRLGVETHPTAPAHLSPQERAAHLREYLQMHPGRTEADFDAQITREYTRATSEAEAARTYRNEVRDQLLDALPPEHHTNLGEVPITVLSPTEFLRAQMEARFSNPDAAIVVRDGQAHIVMRQGADPISVREHAARLNDLVEPGTGGRTRNPVEALPRDLQNRVPIEVNPNLDGATVKVHYDHDPATGLITSVRMEIGPNTRAIDIQNHVETTRALRSYSGMSGRVFKLRERIAGWVGRHGSPPPGTTAFEARLEVEKLPRIIQERAAALQRLGGMNSAEGLHIALEIEHLREQLAHFEQVVRSMEVEPGRGFVAAERLNAEQIKERLAALPEEIQTHLERLDAEVLNRLLSRSEYASILTADMAKLQRYMDAESQRQEIGVSREQIDTYPRTPITDSPLGKEVQQVFQIGHVWEEGGGLYRLIEGVDNGVVKQVYREKLNTDGNWVMRGSDIKAKGDLGEQASRLMDDLMKGPHDFRVHGQNTSGHGFDQVLVRFDEGAVIIDEHGIPRLRDPDYVPRLVIAEDKFMQQVRFESITAINPNLIDNLVDKLFNRLFNVQQEVFSSQAFRPSHEGGLGLTTQWQAEMLLRALLHRRFEFEVRIPEETDLGSIDPKLTPTQLRERILYKLANAIGRQLNAGELPRIAVGTDELRIAISNNHLIGTKPSADLEIPIRRVEIKKDYMDRASESIRRRDRIDETPLIHDLSGRKFRAALESTSAADLRQAWAMTTAMRESSAERIMASAERMIALPGGRFIDLQTGNLFAVVLPPRERLNPATVDRETLRSLSYDIFRQLLQTVRDPTSGSTLPVSVVLDVTHVNRNQLEVLGQELRRLARRSRYDAALDRIITVHESTREAISLKTLLSRL